MGDLVVGGVEGGKCYFVELKGGFSYRGRRERSR